MKGLILKDLYALKKQGRTVLALAGIYLVFAILTKNISFFGFVSISLAVLLPITSMSYDEHYKWDRYAVSLPLARKTIVYSKYVLGLILNLGSTISIILISLVAGIFLGEIQYNEILASILGISAAGILLLALLLPAIYKFGVEKARLIMLIAFLVPTVGVTFISQSGVKFSADQVAKILLYGVPVGLVLLVALSVALSVRIYEQKEF